MNRQQQYIALRGRIVGLHESGLSARAIAQQLGIARSTVQRWLRRWEESADLTDHRRGRPARKTTPEEDRQICQAADENPFTNAVAIRDNLNLDISARTIRRRLHEGNIHHRTPAIKQKLTDQHRASRLLFAQQYVDRDLDFWGRVIFTDEKTFSSTSHGKIHCWRRNDTR